MISCLFRFDASACCVSLSRVSSSFWSLSSLSSFWQRSRLSSVSVRMEKCRRPLVGLWLALGRRHCLCLSDQRRRRETRTPPMSARSRATTTTTRLLLSASLY